MTDVPAVPQSQNLAALFRRNVSSALCADIVRVIRDASRSAATEAESKYSRDQAKECQPWMRRAELGSALLFLADIHPITVTSSRSNGSSYYLRIDSGLFTLLVARAPNANAVLPTATYRTAIATQSLQEELFDGPAIPIGARFYGVILYGGPTADVDPQFITVRFPTRDHGAYLDDQIDLKSEHSVLFSEVVPVEQIEDASRELKIRLMKDTGSTDET